MKKGHKIAYWITTVWLALGMVSTGIGQLILMAAGQGGLDMMKHLGYPQYFSVILGVWKILGSIAILAPKLPRIKEWAYAGFFFTTSGAIVSHLAVGDGVVEVLPALLLLVLTVLSWYLRPASRKLMSGKIN